MKKSSLLLTIFFVFAVFICSCASKNGMKATEKGDQVASEEIVFTEKKLVLDSNGKPSEYQYIFKNKVIAKEYLDENGEILSVKGEIPNGLIKQYSADGKLVAENNFNAGKFEGVNKTYFSDGKTVATVKNYKMVF